MSKKKSKPLPRVDETKTEKLISLDGMAYEINNVGGIGHLDLVLVPGVNVLRGPNAAGKSSAIKAVIRAQGGKQILERRDGTERGTVTGPGVSLSIRKVVQATGAAELELADVGPLAKLIDPKLQNTDAAARERIRALAELLELQVDDESLQALSPGEATPLEWLRREVNLEAVDDLLTASGKLRDRFHKLARDSETIAEAEDLKIMIANDVLAELGREITRRIGTPERTETPASMARADLNEGIREHERLIGRSEERTALERKQGEIRDTLGPRPPIVDFLAKRDAVYLELREANEWKISLRQAANEARGRAVDGEHAAEMVLARCQNADRELERVAADAGQWDTNDAILSKEILGPLPGELEALKVELVDERVERLWHAEKSEEYLRQEHGRIAAKMLRDAETDKADTFRELAGAIAGRLGEILRGAGAALTVVDGRLHSAETPPRDFENRLSTGERVALALDVAAVAYAGKVLPLDGEYWTALDPAHQSMFARFAALRGLYVLTEEPTAGELRVESI